jgi:arylsulfatase A-like enzyme
MATSTGGSALLASVACGALLAACTGSPAVGPTTTATVRPPHPNILVVLTDDQRWDSIDQMPSLRSDPAWARFSQFFIQEPECCPSRATILTGRDSHHTGVQTLTTGKDLDDTRTIATMLQGDGYRTALIGKYLNDYPFKAPHYIPPGWTSFVANEGAVNYFDYDLNDNGTLRHFGRAPEDYSTDVLTNKARAFIDATDPGTPFYVEIATAAPHFTGRGFPPVPAPRDAHACADRTFTMPANFNSHDARGEPPWMAAARDETVDDAVTRLRATCATLQSVDHDLADLIDHLRSTGRLDDTYVVYLSDNGYGFGEHRLMGKGDLFDESLRVPLLVRGPGVVPSTLERLTSNADLVPTELEWAGVKAPPGFLDGTSFAADVRGQTGQTEPTEILLRGCRTTIDSGQACGGDYAGFGLAWGLRTTDFKYVQYDDGYQQLFDLRTDPLETTNLALDPANAATVADLHDRMVRVRGPEGPAPDMGSAAAPPADPPS